ncbi:MAG: radical SAM protein [Candidatus Gastranaerophilales bacterium]|nr:radical SAM protein [Candidatus Gastranaerophilales bacterium]
MSYFKHKKCFWINIAMAQHCNLNCKGCAVFSPLAEKNVLSFSQPIKDFEHIKSISREIIDFKFSYLGGEPLLNPNFLDIVKRMRELFPNSYQDFLTNGLLLPDNDEEFWKTIKKLNLNIFISKYPIDIDRTNYEKLAKKFSVKINYRTINSTKIYSCKTRQVVDNCSINNNLPWTKNVLDLLGTQNHKEKFNNCPYYGGLIYSNGNLYSCCIHAYIQNFINYFKVDIPITYHDYICVQNLKNIAEIDSFLQTPKPLCRFCKQVYIFSENEKQIEWDFSNKSISEWT